MFEERGGLAIIGGLVVITVVATGLALVMEKRSESAKRNDDATRTIAEDSQALEYVKDDLARAKAALNEISGHAAIAEKYNTAKAASDKKAKSLEGLKQLQQENADALGKLQQEYDNYRAQYVRNIRGAAEGEELAVLTTQSGKEYMKVTITRVTPEGLEIRHEFGSARVAASDLGESWNERFLWR